jgi:hypothetical protein
MNSMQQQIERAQPNQSRESVVYRATIVLYLIKALGTVFLFTLPGVCLFASRNIGGLAGSLVFATFLCGLLLYLVLIWFHHWVRTDTEGLHWQTVFSKKQFGRWEDIADYHLEYSLLSDNVSVVIFQDGSTFRLSSALHATKELDVLKEQIVEKSINASAKLWEYSAIHPQKDWQYEYNLPVNKYHKSILKLISSSSLIILSLVFAVITFNYFTPNFSITIAIIISAIAFFGVTMFAINALYFYALLKTKPFWKTRISVNRQGLSWVTENGNGFAAWEQVIGLRREGRIESEKSSYVISLSGTEESEIHFSGATFFRDHTCEKQQRLPLETIIQHCAPALKGQKMQAAFQQEVVKVSAPRSTYSIAGAKVYSYNLKMMQQMLALFVFVFSILLISLPLALITLLL